MQLSEILPLIAQHPGVRTLAASLRQRSSSSIVLDGLRGSSLAVVLAAADVAQTFLVILPDEEEAGYFYNDMVQLLGDRKVLFFPSSYRRSIKYGQRDAANEILRTDVLTRLAQRDAEALYIITSPSALAERVAPREEMDDVTLRVCTHAEYDLMNLARRLEEIGFRRKDYVYEPGEFALRGSILDIFSYSSEYPYRLDFFGDEVDSIRSFEVQTQLSREVMQEVAIVPECCAGSVGKHATPLVPFTDFLPDDTLIACRDLRYVTEKVQQYYDEGFSQQAIAEQEAENRATSEMEMEAVRQQLRADFMLAAGAIIAQGLKRYPRLLLGGKAEGTSEVIHFDTELQPLFHKDFEQLNQRFMANLRSGIATYVMAESEKQTDRLREILQSLNAEEHATAAMPDLFHPLQHTLHEGFTLYGGSSPADRRGGTSLYTDHQIFDRFHKYNLKSQHARNSKMALTLKELMQFQPGDFVVHADHGIGQFAGLVREIGRDGQMREVIKINYRDGGAVLVSIHALHKLSKYKGREGQPPRLSSLGTGAWERIKERTKSKLKDIARDLILLYSKRREEQGFAFSHDNFMQHELEASFVYEDTPDQLKVTQQVKADMERPQPMDRLVCGDVGFGKTEIAVRAAFKAACDNKQVAVMVPTTVLAHQHYKTFAKRLKNFPVRVEYLSRARTSQQTKNILADLAIGKIDIIVGTHKLIGKSVQFKDLGLLIIDEEQKFGVGVKEKLRQMKVSVDTLTMTATPIPRTLQFSLMGARDLSVISTPPPNRHPIQTEIHTFGAEILADAINFELSRNGQVYIVTHRINRLDEIAALIRKYIPDARYIIGHGQMPPKQLETVVEDFINQEYDVLLSTTIVENGIDIPNANTIIIDSAHHFGLSDLHQMRGRVGRGNRKAFCYLLAPPLSALPDDCRRRLQAIENFSDLGSGIHIAMQDLDIRGAGNLLGAEQSGFIADLGYETYQKILAEAVAELHNEMPEYCTEESAEPAERRSPVTSDVDGRAFVAECNIECDLRAYFPETYVPGTSERMLLYRELDGLSDEVQIKAFRDRLIDRFGPLVPEAEELIRVIPLRQLGRRCGVERIVLRQSAMTLYYVSNDASPFYRTACFSRIFSQITAMASAGRCSLSNHPGKYYVRFKGITSVAEAEQLLRQLLGESSKQSVQ